MNFLAFAKNELRLEPFAIVLQRLTGMNRALARCGERAGYDGLIGLLSIESLPIAASACHELEMLTGKSYGLKKEDWSYFLNHLEEPLRIQLITEKLW
jgi:hypothetical protein